MRVIEGEIFDVAVDIRPGSPTYRRWIGERLDADNFRQLWVPPGFAHGFCVLSETAQVAYKCTAYYDRGDEIAISWCDPDLGIEWPIADPLVSDRDRDAPRAARPRTRSVGMLGVMAADVHRAQLTAADLDALRRRGLDRDEVERQLALLADPPPPLELIAAATASNGIERLGEAERPALLELWREAAEEGRLRKLVPASGAASRMFASCRARLESGDDLADRGAERARGARRRDGEGRPRVRVTAARLPVRNGAGGRGRRSVRGDRSARARRPICGRRSARLLAPEGLGFAGLAKGLVPFHRRGERPVTPVEEHLGEAALLVRDRDGVVRVHFTVPENGEDAFRRAARAAEEPDTRFELELSTQSPATDTVALAEDGRPFRTAEGTLLFRPGGHGALLRNLERMAGDLVLVKNIDNVQPEDRRAASILWQRLLVGLLVRLQHEAFDAPRSPRRRPGPEAPTTTLARFSRAGSSRATAPVSDRGALRRKLDRPLRIAGMVVNTGEPGGGPFWTRDREGRVSKQIVETAEIAPTEQQQSILRASTHFNPVLLALALRDRRGRPYRLADFVDSSRVFVSERTAGGSEAAGARASRACGTGRWRAGTRCSSRSRRRRSRRSRPCSTCCAPSISRPRAANAIDGVLPSGPPRGRDVRRTRDDHGRRTNAESAPSGKPRRRKPRSRPRRAAPSCRRSKSSSPSAGTSSRWRCSAVAFVLSGVNLQLALRHGEGAISGGATGAFVTMQLVLCLAGLMVLGKTAKEGTIWGNLFAVGACVVGMSGVLLASALWALA